MNTMPSIVTSTGAIASGQLKRVYQGRSTSRASSTGARECPQRRRAPRSAGRLDRAEGQVHARRAHGRLFGDLVLPGALRVTAHHQQAAVLEREAAALAFGHRAQLEAAPRTAAPRQ